MTALHVVEGAPGAHSNELDELKAWLAAPLEDEDGLLAVVAATESVALHPYDGDKLEALALRVRRADQDEVELDAAWLDITVWIASVVNRYQYEYPTDLGASVRAARRDLKASRGPAVVGANAAFRRGDLVCRPVGRDGKLVAVHDAVYLDTEPWTKHAQQYGRMAAVHVIAPVDQIDRWFLDRLYLGIDFGRPF
tara:strand:- start:349 stop:933 length:585 start_codon:yes stop_codon:yes gene_type:complete